MHVPFSFKILVLVLFFSGSGFSSLTSAQEPLRFAPLPMVPERLLKHDFESFAEYLSQQTNRPVELVLEKSYRKLLDSLLADKIDLAYLGPLPFVFLTQQDPSFVPIVRFVDKSGRSTYTCCLADFRGDHINVDSDRPLLVSLPQPYSTCGYLMSEKLLNRHHYSLSNGGYIYSGNHSESALDVLRGVTQIAGLKTSIADKYHHLGLQVIEQSPPLPGFVLIANPRTVPQELIKTIHSRLLALNPQHTTKDAETTHLWGEGIRYGATEVDTSDYDVIRDMLQQIAIPGIDP
ncbi:PhnD/SsuA/transferrin family substrate-binding protein [Desulfuromonas acetoxidans]|uniref:PhnD/SsuA/transferrin family substrate-binding protein n=1 Tax=Desulfuromonas acetoxidans TaxID=891 RepID=UPI00292F4696|nr:PhnD/SsuA/transferrin family substrate-binding protein [Desulfuromonas acetoxidans]